MDIGLALPIRNDVDAKCNIEIAKKAETLGYDSVWVSDHIVIPHKHKGRFTNIFHDPFVLLSYIAGVTEKIKLGTSLIILPYRNPIVVAKMISTLDQLSEGRVIFGVGTGWMKEEFEILGVPFEERGKRTNEYIEIIKNLWTENDPSFTGEFYNYHDIKFEPKPLQKPYPGIIVGGNSKKAIERAVKCGNGWQPTAISPEEYGEELKQIKKSINPDIFVFSVRNRVDIGTDKNNTAGPGFYTFRGSVSEITNEAIKFRDLGINHLLFDPAVETMEDYYRTMDIVSNEILPIIRN